MNHAKAMITETPITGIVQLVATAALVVAVTVSAGLSFGPLAGLAVLAVFAAAIYLILFRGPDVSNRTEPSTTKTWASIAAGLVIVALVGAQIASKI